MKTKKVKIFIIEDDNEWLFVLKKIFSSPNFEIIGSVSSHQMIHQVLPTVSPDIIIADIVIENALVFSSLEDEMFKNHRIIFITTHLEDYIFKKALCFPKSSFVAKPLHQFTLFSTIDLLLSKYPIESNTQDSFITVRGKQQQQKKIFLDEIVFINVEGNYCFINTLGEKKYVRKVSLFNIQKEIESEDFIQIHKRYIINSNYINRIEMGNNTIFLRQHTIPIGRNFKKNLETYLHKID